MWCMSSLCVDGLVADMAEAGCVVDGPTVCYGGLLAGFASAWCACTVRSFELVAPGVLSKIVWRVWGARWQRWWLRGALMVAWRVDGWVYELVGPG